MSLLSERLRRSRERLGLKQIDVAKKVGISNKTLSGYENEVSSPDYETLKKLASIYGVKTDYLMGHEEPTEEEKRRMLENDAAHLPPEEVLTKYALLKDGTRLTPEESKRAVEFILGQRLLRELNEKEKDRT